MVHMDGKKIRQLNLLHLVKVHFGSNKGLADALGKTDGYATQLCNLTTSIGDAKAREIEALANKDAEWLDWPHPDLWGATKAERAEYLQLTIRFLGPGAVSDLFRETVSLIDAPRK